MPTFALVTSGGTTLGLFELDDNETEPGAIIRRDGQPDRRVVGLLEAEPPPGSLPVLVVERMDIRSS
jgi:hypothetical protein